MNSLTIPQKIKAGFQSRENTYSGKLAYVVYYDNKGVLRKENSWENWRDNKIEPQEYQNEPTEGFVLNKNVGGVRGSYSWNARVERIRVYDPRGFEFEIDLPNLLFILQECSSIKGKGLDGEFVYSWSGKNLVLLPVCCKEYEDSVIFMKLQKMKFLAKNLVEGNIYRFKNRIEATYLGRHKIYREKSRWGDFFEKENKKLYVFKELNNEKDEYLCLNNVGKIAEDLGANECYADEYDKLKKSAWFSPVVKYKTLSKSFKEKPNTYCFLEKDEVLYSGYRTLEPNGESSFTPYYTLKIKDGAIHSESKHRTICYGYYNGYSKTRVTEEDLKDVEFECENGAIFKMR